MPWTITGTQLLAFWTEIFPKIVALAWWSERAGDSPSYRWVFERVPAFRVSEANRIAGEIGIAYGSNIPICVTERLNLNVFIDHIIGCKTDDPIEIIDEKRDPVGQEGADPNAYNEYTSFRQWSCPEAVYGDTFFTINVDGLVMPWPNMQNAPYHPNDIQILAGYLLGGGVLPRTGAAALTAAETNLLTRLTNWPNPMIPPDTPEARCDDTDGLSGVALITLIEQWPKVIAWSWDSTARRTHIINNLRDYIMPEVWSKWPNVREHSNNARDDILLKHVGTNPYIDLTVPLPPRPNLNTIFEQLVIGHASNPMYSNTYS